MKTTLYPCLWFDGKASEAAAFYCSIFPGGLVQDDSGLTVHWKLGGLAFMGLNGGPRYRPNPSVSFFWYAGNEAELRAIHASLIDGGHELMSLAVYDFAPLYAWVEDKYGVSWQLFLKPGHQGAKAQPSVLFSGLNAGYARDALTRWETIFSGAWKPGCLPPPVKSAEPLLYGEAHCGGQVLTVMDSPLDHAFVPDEGLSFVLEAEDQAEIDYYWAALVEGGEESRCGWLKDRFGIYWQVVPAVLSGLLADPSTRDRVIKNFMNMSKFQINKLLE